MTEKKPIPVKYFYYGMLGCVLLISGIFYYLFQKEAGEEKLLKEKGIVAEAWVTNLYSNKTSKRATPNYYMEVAFFADGKTLTKQAVSPISEPQNSDELIANMSKISKSTSKPIGNYETQTIPIGGYDIYKQYKINDRVNVIFLEENPAIIRIKK
jgi:hypothetical protein